MKITVNKIFLGLAVLGLTAFSSCKDSEEKNPENQNTNTQMSGNTADNAETSAEKPEVNPPHGQPFHRCDLPVGASLTGTTNNTGATPPMTTSPIRLKESKPAKNPPHGEPFHDCSIPVGADLQS